MPPKHRGKSDEGSEQTDSAQLEQLQAEHEGFLRAFEKPTQIYRFLRQRNIKAPIFLQRNLLYLRQRLSRDRNTRKRCKIDDLLECLTKEKQAISHGVKGRYMNIIFLGFYDPEQKRTSVKVEAIILKVYHKKRKEVSSPVKEVVVGSGEVPCNPDDDNRPKTTTAISVSSESFNLTNGHLVESYMLFLRVVLQAANSSKNNKLLCNGENEGEEPPLKKLRSSVRENGRTFDEDRRDIKCYAAELTVYDKHNRCVLNEGDYDIHMQEFSSKTQQKKIMASPWDSLTDTDPELDVLKSEFFQKGPVLKFKLSWSSTSIKGQVPYPQEGAKSSKTSSTGRQNTATIPERKELRSRGSRCSNNHVDSEIATNDVKTASKEPVKRHRVFYNFIYNNNIRQQTEAQDDLHCPWCSINCMQLYGLLKHLKLCHSRFLFTYVPHAKGARIDVEINSCYDSSFSGYPPVLLTGRRFTRQGPIRRNVFTELVVIRPRRRTPSLSEFLEPHDTEYDGTMRPYILAHNRLYFHTNSNLPIRLNEVEEDSDDEVDPDWLQTKTKFMIDEFTDVNEGEKELMKLWNLHCMHCQFIADCQLYAACCSFVEEKGRQVINQNLYKNFVVHLVNLCDFNLLKSYHIITILRKLDRLKYQMCREEDVKPPTST